MEIGTSIVMIGDSCWYRLIRDFIFVVSDWVPVVWIVIVDIGRGPSYFVFRPHVTENKNIMKTILKIAIRHLNLEFYDHFWVDDCACKSIFEKLEIV